MSDNITDLILPGVPFGPGEVTSQIWIGTYIIAGVLFIAGFMCLWVFFKNNKRKSVKKKK